MKQLKDLIEDRLMISIRQFAKETGISRHTIAHILNGEGKPSLLTARIHRIRGLYGKTN